MALASVDASLAREGLVLTFSKYFDDGAGATVIEYGLIAALIAVEAAPVE
jgi:hypothetical protein